MVTKLAKLPISFRPYAAADLSRLGRKFDGGYVVSTNDILHSEYLLSFGLSDDWSFEKSCKILNPDITIECFDHTISPKIFGKRFFKYLANSKFKKAIYQIIAWQEYRRFFKGEKKKATHYQRKIGSAKSDTTLSELIGNKQIKDNSLFLKVDIEGDEYRIIDQISESQDLLSGMAIEFHNFDLHKQVISSFVEQLKLKVVSVNVNTHTGVDIGNIPYTLEVVFSRNYEPHTEMIYTNLISPNKKGDRLFKIEYVDQFVK